jgi:hypothetical protein
MRAARLVVMATLALGACRPAPPPSEPVPALLAALEQAVEARDTDAVLACLAANFRGKAGLERGMVQPELERYFRIYDDVRVERSAPEITPEGDALRVRVRAVFSAKSKLPGVSERLLGVESTPFQFDLRLEREGNAWRIAQADWDEAHPQP